jgi:hypothetical protein
MPNNESDVKFKTLDMNAEVRKEWGPKWNEPEVEYEFSSGRKFVRRTEDAAIYVDSPDFPG